jgi:hypothetical protein
MYSTGRVRRLWLMGKTLVEALPKYSAIAILNSK